MTMTTLSRTVDLDPNRNVPGVRRPGFPHTLRAEWIKFWSVRSTFWSTAMLFVLGAGLTVLVCATSAGWLASGEAQQIWVDRGGALSGNTKVTKYPDDISQRSAEILTGAKIFRFDGGDLMPSALKADFFRAMVDYTEDPSQLDTILDRLDTTAEGAYAQ